MKYTGFGRSASAYLGLVQCRKEAKIEAIIGLVAMFCSFMGGLLLGVVLW